MKRRLRKKLGRGEFTIFGFRVTGTNGFGSVVLMDATIDAWDAEGVLVSGSFGRDLVVELVGCSGCGGRHPPRYLSESDRERARAFFSEQGVTDLTIGSLVPERSLFHA